MIDEYRRKLSVVHTGRLTHGARNRPQILFPVVFEASLPAVCPYSQFFRNQSRL